MSKSKWNEEEALHQLDTLRRSSGIRIDARGRWWHHHSPFEHPRVIETLNKGLQWLDTSDSSPPFSSVSHPLDHWSGEAQIHIGNQWCYIGCDYTPFLVLKLRADPKRGELIAILNTGEEFPLGALSLRDEILFSRLSIDRLARLSTRAQLQIEPWLSEESGSTEEMRLCLSYGFKRWPISIEPHD